MNTSPWLRPARSEDVIAAHAEIVRAERLADSIRAQALNPEGGWWEKSSGPRQKLRREAVLEAYSVGATAKSSGASPHNTRAALREMKRAAAKPRCRPQSEWPALVLAARATMTPADFAAAYGICYRYAKRLFEQHAGRPGVDWNRGKAPHRE